MADSARAFVRIAVVVLFSALTLLVIVPDVIAPWHPWGSFGFDASVDGRITKVYRGLPADRAGIKRGDHIDMLRADFGARRASDALSLALPGTTATFPMIARDGTQRTVSLVAEPFPRIALDNITDMIAVFVSIAFVVIAAALVLARPSLLTWSFFFYAVGAQSISAFTLETASDAGWIAVNEYIFSSQLVGALALVCFASIFPRDRAEGWRVPVLLTLSACTLIVVAVNGYAIYAGDTNGAFELRYGAPIQTFENVFTILMYVTGIVLFAINYLSAPAVERPRIRWVMLGFIVGFSGILAITVSQTLPAIAISPPVWAINALAALNIFVPVTVAYAILRHRVIDVRFFLSRALVYGLLTTLAVAVLALLEWAIAHQLEASGFSVLVEIAGAVLVGLGINRAHGAIDRFVDRFVFRSIHDAERHFATIGRAMLYVRSVSAIDALVAEESARALHLSGAAVYHGADDGGFRRSFSSGTTLPDGFDHDHRVVLHLLAERTSIERDGQLAVPFSVRDRLLGFALFGAHSNSSAIDPNERALLESLCSSASNAYDHVTGEERAEENQRLRTELTILKAKYDEIRSLVRFS